MDLYKVKTKKLLENKNFLSNKSLGLIMPKYKSFEIDDYLDLLISRTIYKNINTLKKKMKNNSGQKLLSKAKNLIPGGNQLLSKRSERFLIHLWPVYYKKAKGCQIWDLENRRFYDFAGMGVTACVLGYADKDINSAINFAKKMDQ